MAGGRPGHGGGPAGGRTGRGPVSPRPGAEHLSGGQASRQPVRPAWLHAAADGLRLRHWLLGGGGRAGADRRGGTGPRDQRRAYRRPDPAADRGLLGRSGHGTGSVPRDPGPPHSLVHDRWLCAGGHGDLLRPRGDRRAGLRLRRRDHQHRHRTVDRRPGDRTGRLHPRSQSADRRLRPGGTRRDGADDQRPALRHPGLCRPGQHDQRR